MKVKIKMRMMYYKRNSVATLRIIKFSGTSTVQITKTIVEQIKQRCSDSTKKSPTETTGSILTTTASECSHSRLFECLVGVRPQVHYMCEVTLLTVRDLY